MVPRSKSTITKKERKRHEIISVAREIFTKYGYKKTSVVDIADQIGLDQATIYYYFDNKENLYIACVFDEIKEFKKNVKRVLAKSSSIQELIINIFTERLRFFHEKNLIHNFTAMNMRKINEHLRIKLENLQEFEHQIITKVLKHSVKSGELPSIDTSQLAATLILISKGYMYKIRSNNLLSEEKVEFNQMVKDLQQSISYLFEMIPTTKK